MQIGLIGLGRMGANMTRRLMRAGHDCVVHDVNAQSVAALSAQGATGAATLPELVQRLEKPRGVESPWRVILSDGNNTVQLVYFRAQSDWLKKLYPIMRQGASDSAQFDNVLEFLCLAGRELPEAILMMIPEAWSGHETMDEVRKAFFEYHACLF